jgi:uncharacterized pyridoxamine 5'-phosphate oxidase family protein
MRDLNEIHDFLREELPEEEYDILCDNIIKCYLREIEKEEIEIVGMEEENSDVEILTVAETSDEEEKDEKEMTVEKPPTLTNTPPKKKKTEKPPSEMKKPEKKKQ